MTKKGMIARGTFTSGGGDRSNHAGMAAPFEWGPGPWDYDDFTWRQRCRMSGDLRLWQVGCPITGGPVVCRQGPDKSRTGTHGIRHPGAEPDEEDMLLSTCWCQDTVVRIPRDWVRECYTVSCGAAECMEPG